MSAAEENKTAVSNSLDQDDDRDDNDNAGAIAAVDEVDAVATTKLTTPNIVFLNIGGVKYTTTRETLLGAEGKGKANFFTALLTRNSSGTGNVKFAHSMVGGAYFIDRDGEPFHLLLSYLRSRASATKSGALQLLEAKEHATLLNEAAFYGVHITEDDVRPAIVEVAPAAAAAETSATQPATAAAAATGFQYLELLPNDEWRVVLRTSRDVCNGGANRPECHLPYPHWAFTHYLINGSTVCHACAATAFRIY